MDWGADGEMRMFNWSWNEQRIHSIMAKVVKPSTCLNFDFLHKWDFNIADIHGTLGVIEVKTQRYFLSWFKCLLREGTGKRGNTSREKTPSIYWSRIIYLKWTWIQGKHLRLDSNRGGAYERVSTSFIMNTSTQCIKQVTVSRIRLRHEGGRKAIREFQLKRDSITPRWPLLLNLLWELKLNEWVAHFLCFYDTSLRWGPLSWRVSVDPQP